jgi:hypothetical protein
MKNQALAKHLFILMAFVLVSCESEKKDWNSSSTYTFMTAKSGHFGMDIYKDMDETTELNDVAVMQYANESTELYLIVIEESKQEFLKALATFGEMEEGVTLLEKYRQTQIMNTGWSIKFTSEKNPEPLKINGLNACIQEFSGKTSSSPEIFALHFGFIESPQNLYMIMTWTLEKNKALYRDMFRHSIRSFRLVKN